MKTKLLTMAAALALSSLTLPAANIAWVSLHSASNTPSAAALAAGFTNAPDVAYTTLLAANGHNVTRFLSVDSIQNFPDLTNSLATNDLIIVSRSVGSGPYDNVLETAVWNGFSVPFMSLGGYINRAVRLGFHTGDTIPDVNSSQMRLKVLATGHPIFAGIALNSTNLMINPYNRRVTFTNATTGVTNLQNGVSVVTSPLVAGGTALATVGTPGDAAFGGMVVGEFPPGTKSQRGDTFVGRRLVFLTGSREAGITGDGAGIFDLLPDGQQLFLNAVAYMLSSHPPLCTVPLVSASNLAPGDAWTFTAGPIGDAPLSYQWYKNNLPITDATNAALAFTNLALVDAGNYALVVTNLLGSATSTVGTLSFIVFPPTSITNSLISYWPLDTILGTKTPDLVSGYDMTLTKLGATNLVAGKFGNAFQFDNAWQGLLSRSHNTGDDLPIYKHPNFTVSIWVNGPVQSDHRIYAEGSLTNTTPLFDLGTHNAGTDGTVDLYIRTDNGTVFTDHRHSTGIAFDYFNWHNIVYVQRDVGNGNMKAQLWVDGVLDPVAIAVGRPITANTTAIGGLRRTSDSAWFTGLIDDVAVWNRALSAEEIGILQVTSITNPPSRLQPLAINSFKADLPALAAGASTTLRWDVSKDATQVTVSPLGDVTADTSVGIGARTINPAASTTYVLTVKRGTDILSATSSVAVIQGIASGWTLLDNFDQYPVGNLFANGYWNDASGGSAQVLTVNGNRAIRTTTGGSIVFLNLRNLTVTEHQARTLFFRVIAGADNASAVTNIVGLTDKSMRSYGDEFLNIGPVLYQAAFTNSFIGADTNGWYLGARNGWLGNNTSSPIDYPGPLLESHVVYNVWIDITNASFTTDFANDTFTVYLQKEGDATRTVVFQDYSSDRDPYYVDAVLGGFLPNLDKLVVIGNNATFSPIYDDFYLSTSSYNATVPRPYGFTGTLPGPLSLRRVGSQLEIKWTNGTLQQATDLSGPWADAPGNPASPYLVTPSGAATYYRSRL